MLKQNLLSVSETEFVSYKTFMTAGWRGWRNVLVTWGSSHHGVSEENNIAPAVFCLEMFTNMLSIKLNNEKKFFHLEFSRLNINQFNFDFFSYRFQVDI